MAELIGIGFCGANITDLNDLSYVKQGLHYYTVLSSSANLPEEGLGNAALISVIPDTYGFQLIAYTNGNLYYRYAVYSDRARYYPWCKISTGGI